jgi:hypothetical protein
LDGFSGLAWDFLNVQDIVCSNLVLFAACSDDSVHNISLFASRAPVGAAAVTRELLAMSCRRLSLADCEPRTAHHFKAGQCPASGALYERAGVFVNLRSGFLSFRQAVFE